MLDRLTVSELAPSSGSAESHTGSRMDSFRNTTTHSLRRHAPLVARTRKKLSQRDTLMFCTAAIALTAGGGCGFDCRRERNLRDRKDMLNHVDETLSRNLKDCEGDPDCEEEERDAARSRRRDIDLWYQEQVDNNHEESREAREWVRNFTKEIGKEAVEKLSSKAGSVTGIANLRELVALPIERHAVAPTTNDGTIDSGGVSENITSSSAAAAGAAQSIAQSPIVETRLIRELHGSFTLNLATSDTVDPGSYTFNFSFAAGNNRSLNGLNVRRLTAGAATLSGTALAIVLNPEVGQSQLVLGQDGIGLLRLAGELVSTDPTETIPFHGFLKIDLPARENPDGSITIETDGVVDLNILADVSSPWYVDYDGDGEVTPADRSQFITDHAIGKVWTDLNGDDVSDVLDIERFDERTAEALARLVYLASQGIHQ